MNNTIMGKNGIKISNSGPGMPYINPSSNPAVGTVRYNSNTQNLEIFTGGYDTWVSMPRTYTEIELDQDIQTVLIWAKQAMQREKEIEELANEYPAVAEIKEKMDLIIQLVKNHKGA